MFFWHRLTRLVPDKLQRAVKRLCVCVCVCVEITYSRVNVPFHKKIFVHIILDVTFSIFHWMYSSFTATLLKRTNTMHITLLLGYAVTAMIPE